VSYDDATSFSTPIRLVQGFLDSYVEQPRRATTSRRKSSQVLRCGRLVVTFATSYLTLSILLSVAMTVTVASRALSRHFPTDLPCSLSDYQSLLWTFVTQRPFVRSLVYPLSLRRLSACG
jgi:hypothetical protein